MSIPMRFLPFMLLSAGVLGLMGMLQLREDPPHRDREQLAPLVETVPVSRCLDGFRLRVDGEVIPYREINLATEVSGRIVTKAAHARAGRYVNKGSLLFQIDPQDYELELRRLQETVKEASSSIEEADIEKSNVEQLIELADDRLELQRAEVARFEGLRERNAASDSQLEAARQAELQLLNSLQTLRNQVSLVSARRNRLLQEKERAMASLDLARLKLSRTTITSPIDGVIVEDLAEQDDYVQVGASLAQLEDTSKAEVRFNLRLEQLRWLWGRAGQSTGHAASQNSYALPPLPVRVHVELDGNGFFWTARLDRYDGAGIKATTRTVPVIAVVEDPTAVRLLDRDGQALPLPAPPTLMRGSFVTVEIPVGSSLDLVTIPTIALRPGGRVWALRDGKLAIARVNVAHAAGTQAILHSDPHRLAVGDEVITTPLPLVVEGMELRRDDTRGTRDASLAVSETPTADAL